MGFGNHNLTSTVTAGIVSAKAEIGTSGIQSFIQTDAAVRKAAALW
jgi:S1-C subfamily serine protease